MTSLIRYRVRPNAAQTRRAAVEKVFAALHAQRPAGLRYRVTRLDDGISFGHLVTGDDHPLAASEASSQFQHRLRDRLVDGPTRDALTIVGSSDSEVDHPIGFDSSPGIVRYDK